MKEFTKEQVQQIKELNLNIDFAYGNGGKKGDLKWGIYENKIYADLSYEARDVDGDWGFALKRHDNLTFEELLETIKAPHSKFDTRSWN